MLIVRALDAHHARNNALVVHRSLFLDFCLTQDLAFALQLLLGSSGAEHVILIIYIAVNFACRRFLLFFYKF